MRSDVAQRDDRFAGAVQEHVPVLAGSSATGAPKVTEHRMGTGTTSPLGMTRCTLSIQAGTSTTCGNRSARLYSPALNGCGSSPWPRVPSGNRMMESPLPSACTSGSQRVLLAGAGPVHVDGVEDAGGDPLAERLLVQ
jgi:hypothetical protein